LTTEMSLQMHDTFDKEYSQEMNAYSTGSEHQKSFTSTKALSTITTFYQHSRSLYYRKQHMNSLAANRLVNLDHVRTQVDSAMDDNQFQSLIKDSNVLMNKDDKKWQWEPIVTLIYGPLRVPSRLNEVMTKTKLVKRILAFFTPKERAFSELKYTEAHSLFYVNLGCQLIENLLSTPEGIAFLSKSQFFEEIKEILDIELEKNPEMNPNRVLSEKDVAYYLCRDYFTIIGKISSIPQGVKLLQDFKIFNSLCSLVNSKREDIAQLIIKHMDYLHSNKQISQPARSILQEAMKGSKKIRYFTTLLIRKLLREYPKSDFLNLGIQLTLSQTNDDWEDLSRTSLQIIANTCRSPETLDILISLNPSVEQLEKQKEGRDLLLRMLSRESGFRYLQQNGWILPTLQSWKDKKNH